MINNQVQRVFTTILNEIEQADIIAINRAMKTAHSKTVDFIRSEFPIKKQDINRVIKLKRATRSHKFGLIIVKGKGLGLIAFRARQTKRGVTYQYKVSGSRILFEGSFIATMASGHKGVMVRSSDAVRKYRLKDKQPTMLPIKEKFGLSVSQLYGSEEAEKFIDQIYLLRFNIEFARALEYLAR